MRYLDLPTAKQWSAIGLGTWQFGSREWGYGQDYAQGPDSEAAKIVQRALDLGVTVFDTAEAYGFGRSERILGEALDRADADPATTVVATKIFPVLPVDQVVVQRGTSSAARLRRKIDLYQVHQPNPVIGDRTTMAGMRTLQAAGVVDEVGVSNYGLDRWQGAETALGTQVLANQVQYSLVAREPDDDLLPYARTAGRAILAYSPLAQGLLSGKFDAEHRPANRVRSLNPLFLPESLRRVTPLIETLRAVADAHDATPSQVALAWTIHHPVVVAIPGASSVAQLESNCAAAEIRLGDDEYTALTAAAASFRPVGGLAALTGVARAQLGVG
ncbi:putative oxidoreductase [Actinomycetospora sp. NBRC 106375]|uniref:aldo/keto reductase n=1 Tax=Actinomycetospora sp. NBRC 106375 TaxID=3032207 RepID=UPI00249FC12A|nr:aldo/keto reductase [Actinomycetospora sp. NBRC 106375]GLZ46105.1 putative oxidoreductase [Actinomycetospora sp. NBRC 106375]